jgi:hypothetical protein
MPESAPRIVIRLSADLSKSVPYQDNVVSTFPPALAAAWAALLPGLTLDRALPTIDVDAVRRKLDLNAQQTGTPSENLLSFFAMTIPPGFDADALVDAARTLPFVEHAFVESPLRLAGVNFADDPLVAAQGYLGPAPVCGHYVARLLDLFDLMAAAYRLAVR